MRGRLASIDALRGVAALAVLGHHTKTAAFDLPAQPAWLRAVGAALDWGNLGVPLFFVLSGFCIHARTLRGEARGEALAFGAFWKRRLFRLYPPYVVVLCGSMALVVLAASLGKHLAMVTQYPEPRARWIALDFAAHASMLHGLIPAFDLRGGNPALWTLAREEYLYLLYFPLLFANRRWGMRVTAVLVLAIGAGLSFALRPVVAAHPAWASVLLASALVLWIQWALGMLAAEVHFGRTRLPAWCASAWAIAPAAAMAYAAPRVAPDLEPALWGLVFFVLVSHCVRREQAGRWPGRGPVAWLAGVGLWSYSLYLVHGPVCGLVRQALGARAQTEDPMTLLAFAVGTAAIGCGAGFVFFRLVERHFLGTNSTSAATP